MKIVLDKDELAELLLAAVQNATGFTDITNIDLDLGDGAVLSFQELQGLIVQVKR